MIESECRHENFVFVGPVPTNTTPVTESGYRCPDCKKELRGYDRLPGMRMTIQQLESMRNYFRAHT